jgi:SAM-dependent methyltransferase
MTSLMKRYLDAMVAEGLRKNRRRLLWEMRTLFQDIRLEGQRVLDVGGGYGEASFYAAASGARNVICLEPDAAGSRSGVRDRYAALQNRLQDAAVTLLPVTLQDFELRDDRFDVIVLNDSVNHLDESSCVTLLEDERSRERYRTIFAKIHALATSNAVLIVTDCSRDNFYARLGLRNPFAPTIEWHKHQRPEVWASLLEAAGFRNPTLRWSSFNSLRWAGRALLANRVAGYFLHSHFALVLRRVEA